MSEYTREQVIEMVTKGESLEGADLSGIDLSGVDLRSKKDGGGCERAVNFQNTKLIEVDLRWTKLEGANLKQANLVMGDLRWSNLTKANICQANLSKADLRWCNLIKANLGNSDLRQTKLLQADLIEANLSNAKLNMANLNEALLNKVNLNGAVLNGATFRGAKLFQANISNTKLSEANFNNADLEMAELIEAYLSFTNFEYADLTNSDISGANIYHLKTHGWKIYGIKCSHVYQCPNIESWNDLEKRKKYRYDFAPNKFEDLYKTLPSILLFFKQEFNIQDYKTLTTVIEQINQRLMATINIGELRKSINTSIALTSKNKEVLNILAPMIYKTYQKLSDEYKGKQQINLEIPEIYIENLKFDSQAYFKNLYYSHNQYSFSSADEVERTVLQIIAQLLLTDKIQDSINQIDKKLSSMFDKSPDKKKLFEKAFSKHKCLLYGVLPTITKYNKSFLELIK